VIAICKGFLGRRAVRDVPLVTYGKTTPGGILFANRNEGQRGSLSATITYAARSAYWQQNAHVAAGIEVVLKGSNVEFVGLNDVDVCDHWRDGV
jgi:hypothetical protein